MAFDPTQQVPPPGYPPQPTSAPQPGYALPQQQPAYPQPPGYVAPPPPFATYTQYNAPFAAPGAKFDFVLFWKSMGLTGQGAGIGGILMFFFFLLPWYSPSAGESHNGFGSASGIEVGNVTVSYFPYLWLIFLGILALIAIACLLGMWKIGRRTASIATSELAGLFLLLEICFLIEVNSFKDSTSVGFWLAFIATLAVLGLAVYELMQGSKGMNPLVAAPYPPQVAYPGAQAVYQQPGLPYQPPAYSGPQPPAYQNPGQPPQSPGQ